MELEGRLVDVQGQPVAGAVVMVLSRELNCFSPDFDPILDQASPRVRRQLLALRTSDDQGRFRCPSGAGSLVAGKMATLRIITRQKCEYELNFVVGSENLIHVPTLVSAKVLTPANVSKSELAGVVVDGEGHPLEGVEVDAWDWYPGNEMTTGKDGTFRLKDLNPDRRVEVRFRKPGYSPETFVRQPTGVSGWIVALSDKTYWEGIVRGSDGKPASGAVLRANQGPKLADGVVITNIWTETTADASGSYRLYVQPDDYELLVEAKEIGVARLPKRSISHGEALPLDVQLQVGVTFQAKVVDSETGRPVPNVRLWNWQHEGVEGRSDANGMIHIDGMIPGEFEFSVEADGISRWWSDEANNDRYRRATDRSEWIHQSDFHDLNFELRPEMGRVTIVVERGVRIRGRIVDPDGKPVGGATTALRLPSTHTIFGVTTKPDGSFEMSAPASHDSEYNLTGHDGEFVKDEWRGWANGVLPPFRTKPGEELNGIELRLTRPGTVRGRVVDKQGRPVAPCEVWARAVDNLENDCCNPNASTKEDGTFELPFLRPGEHEIHVENSDDASTKRVAVQAGQIVSGLELVTNGSTLNPPDDDAAAAEVDHLAASRRAPGAQEFHFQVVTTKDKPVAGAKVTLTAVRLAAIRGTSSPAQDVFPAMKTDAEGIVRVVLPVDGDSLVAVFSRECIKLGIEGFGFAVDHPDHPVWWGYVDIGRDARIVLSDPLTIEVRVHRGNDPGLLSNLYPALSGTFPDWTEANGVLTIRRVDLTGERPSRWLRIVHVPVQGPALFSDLIDLQAHKESPLSLQVSVRQGCRVAGELSGNVPRPVKHGRIVANVVAGTDAWTNWHWEAVADIAPDGSFVLESLPTDENLQLIALCDGWVSTSPSKAEVANYGTENGFPDWGDGDGYGGPSAARVFPRLYRLSGTDIAVVVPMEATAACEVTVLDPEGNPLPDASVSFNPNQVFFNSGSEILGQGSDQLANVRTQLISGKHQTAFHRDRDVHGYFAKTDARGVAFVPNLPAGGENGPVQLENTRFEVSHERYAAPANSLHGQGASVKILPGQTARTVVRLKSK